ncbi:MAG: hypothetical protein JNL98_25410, partial [Bryobacterales bacterium]|nr:hypothetical protein [Bryobacterales bacterium]
MKCHHAFVWVLLIAVPGWAQPKPESGSPTPEANDGIPVTSDVVKNSCGGCHKTD